jgi:hypothetical protein
VPGTTPYRSTRRNNKRRTSNSGTSALRFIAKAEERIAKQKCLIGRLKKTGCSTESAEAVLKTFEHTLLGLQTYHQLMQELTAETKS